MPFMEIRGVSRACLGPLIAQDSLLAADEKGSFINCILAASVLWRQITASL
tara:strand:+ start:408 stop:560 length:153 start_codon:yes stop_codon:yes gene_type:complete